MITKLTVQNFLDESFKNLIDQYQIWRDYEKFYHNRDHVEIEISKSGIPCFFYQDINSIKDSDCPVVLIQNLTESLHSSLYFVKYPKDKKYIILSGGEWNKERVLLPFEYENINFNFFLMEMTDTYLSPNRFCFYLDKNYQFGSKPLIFISTTGNVRPERDLLIRSLKNHIEYDNFNIRYSGENIGVECDRYDVIKINSGEFDPYKPLSNKYYHNISQTLPIDLYNLAYANLVIESDIDLPDSFFLTEKMIKCLIVGMPFVVYATPHYLKHLRLLGFKTYDNLWDERYDDEIDLHARCQKIVDLMNHLGKFDWQEKFPYLQDIANHNKSVFFQLNQIRNQKFQELEKHLTEGYKMLSNQS